MRQLAPVRKERCTKVDRASEKTIPRSNDNHGQTNTRRHHHSFSPASSYFSHLLPSIFHRTFLSPPLRQIRNRRDAWRNTTYTHARTHTHTCTRATRKVRFFKSSSSSSSFSTTFFSSAHRFREHSKVNSRNFLRAAQPESVAHKEHTSPSKDTRGAIEHERRLRKTHASLAAHSWTTHDVVVAWLRQRTVTKNRGGRKKGRV